MKLVLDNKNLTDDFFEDTKLLGIMAPIKDYQLCWHLNSLMGMDFRINNDIEIQLTKKKRNYFFAVYEFCEPTGSLFHYVYNNRFDGEYLLPEFKHPGFLMTLWNFSNFKLLKLILCGRKKIISYTGNSNSRISARPLLL